MKKDKKKIANFSIRITQELLDKARAKDINVSEVARYAILLAVNGKFKVPDRI